MTTGGVLGGLGSLFGGGTTPEEQQRAAIFQAGLAALASAQQPGASFGGSLFSGFQAGAGALQQAQQNAFQSKRIKQQEEREERLLNAELSRAKLEEQKAAREARDRGATAGQRFSTGLEKYKADPLGYFNVVKSDPDLQAAASQIGFDLSSVNSPEQVTTLGQQLGAYGSIGTEPAKTPPLELKAVVGPDGKPRFVNETDALGQQPYYQPDRRGLAVTLPDGTTISDGPSVVQPGELTKPTVNKLQETIVNAQGRLDRVNQTLSTYKPEFLQAKGLLKAKTGELTEFLGGELDPDSKKFLQQYSEFRATAAADFNQTLNELSGQAVTDGEARRALQAAPSPDDKSPTQFEAKAKATTKTIRRAILRANYALKNGIGTKSIDELSKLIPLEAVDAIYEARVNEIFDELGGTDDKRQEAILRANQEFGVAR